MRKITGATAHINLNFDLMRKAGINALRYGFGFPFEEDGKTPGKRFMDAVDGAVKLRNRAFSSWVPTLVLVHIVMILEKKRTTWVSSIPSQ